MKCRENILLLKSFIENKNITICHHVQNGSRGRNRFRVISEINEMRKLEDQ